ncbi:MAG: DUF5666 domain-containing protein [Acidimicrobiales bacterium]
MKINRNSTDHYSNSAPSSAPARRWANRSRLASAAVGLAVVVGTGAGTVAVAQAATTGPSHSSTSATWSTKHGTPPAAAGTVEDVGTNSFMLKGRDGTTVAVDVSSSTTYRDPKVASPSFTNVKVGEMVIVEGTTSAGVVTATSVSIGFGGHMARG